MHKFERPCFGGPCTEKGMTEPGFCKCKEAADEIERLRAALQQFADLDSIDEYSGHRINQMAVEALDQQSRGEK